MTELLYLKNTYLFDCESRIVEKGHDEKGMFITLDQTIFYPQGGGQLCDQGIIENEVSKVNVTFVKQIEDETRHYIDGDMQIDTVVKCHVDQKKRLRNARYHTSAHLIGNCVETLYPSVKAVKGHSFPKEAYIECQGNVEVNATYLQEFINQSIQENQKTKVFEMDKESFEKQFYKLSYPIPLNKSFRILQIGDFLPVPCGGTHVSFLQEIGYVLIKKVKLKNNIVRISYELE